MGGRRDSEVQSQGQSTQSVTPEPLPEQREQIKLALERQKAAQPGLLQLDKGLLDAIIPLASGGSLPGQFEELGQGISPEVQQELVNRSLDSITPRLESLGILNSGVTAELSSRAATDIFLQSELEKIRQRENLVNVLQGFPATVNQPILQSNQTLAAQLAGLTPVNTSGSFSGSQTTFGPSFGRTLSQNFAQKFGGGLGRASAAGVFAAGQAAF